MDAPSGCVLSDLGWCSPTMWWPKRWLFICPQRDEIHANLTPLKWFITALRVRDSHTSFNASGIELCRKVCTWPGIITTSAVPGVHNLLFNDHNKATERFVVRE